MRNKDMERLDVLVGSWVTTMSNAWFMDPADLEVAGSATVEWLGDAFVVFRWTMQGDVGAATSEQVLVLGRSDAQDEFTALYHDERGVCRVFAMTFVSSHLILSREDPDMFQQDAKPDGVKFIVNSGWRSVEYQDQLLSDAISRYGSAKEAARWVATSRTSAHVSGRCCGHWTCCSCDMAVQERR